jgi:hypothetical protein
MRAPAGECKHLEMFAERRQQLGEGGQPAKPQTFTISISD